MGRRFSVNGRVLSAGPAHVFNAFLSADVLDAQRRVKGSGNFNISGDQCVFSLTGGTFEAQGPGCCAAAVDAVFGDITLVFLVQADREFQFFGDRQGFCQKGSIHDGQAVIGETGGSAGGKGAKVVLW